MWTPRRIILLVVGVMVFCGGYVAYSIHLGWIDGLPQLPAEFLTVRDGASPHLPIIPTNKLSPVDQKLKLAFGDDCKECRYLIKMDLHSRGVVIAADLPQKFEDDGRVKLSPFSAIIFKKKGNEPTNEVPEFTTFHCDIAYLEFEKPIRAYEDMMDKAKLVSVEMVSHPPGTEDPIYRDYDRIGKIHITQNRKTATPSDDLYARTTGPVFYHESPGTLASRVGHERPITIGTGHGRDELPHIWTAAVIEVFDRLAIPAITPEMSPEEIAHIYNQPTVKARGLNIYLSQPSGAINPPALAAEQTADPNKTKPKTASGIKRIELCSHVLMNLWIDSKSGLMAGDKPKAKDELNQPEKRPEKTQLQIKTQGPFRYEFAEDKAHFDLLPRPDLRVPNSVEVVRAGKESSNDILTCDHLEIQFKPKSAASASGLEPKQNNTPSTSITANLDIEYIHAWGKQVALTSDAEELEAFGTDLVYDARTQETRIRGEPSMTATKQGNVIHARELRLYGSSTKAESSSVKQGSQLKQAIAQGPGLMRIPDASGTNSYEIRWSENMMYERVAGFEKDQQLDLITLNGNASFEDMAKDQHLRAQQLKVWLDCTQQPQPQKMLDDLMPAKDQANAQLGPIQLPPAMNLNDQAKGTIKTVQNEQQRPSERQRPLPTRRPYRIQGFNNVVASSPELYVREADHLNVWFQDMPEAEQQRWNEFEQQRRAQSALSSTRTPKTDRALLPQGASVRLAQFIPNPPAAANPAGVGQPPLARQPDEPRRPLNLVARNIEAYVWRLQSKYELNELHCAGECRVTQDPAPGEPRGTDVRGQEIHLRHHYRGDILDVCSRPPEVAYLQLSKLDLTGPQIHVDQQNNVAKVQGAGSMQVLASTDLEGRPLERASTVTIQWNKQMLFSEGRVAQFEGGVQAEQMQSTILCQEMQVFFNQPISLNPAMKSSPKAQPGQPPLAHGGDEPAKIERVVCHNDGRPDQPVTVIDQALDPQTQKRIRYQRINAATVSFDNLNKTVEAPGPGMVTIVQKGAKDTATPAARPAPKTPAAPQPGANDRPNQRLNPGVGQPKMEPAEEEMKVTRINYRGQLVINNQKKEATFFDQVEAVYVQGDDPDMAINPYKLPPGGIFLRCGRLHVHTVQLKDNVTAQIMEAHHNASVSSTTFRGEADLIRYDQSKDLLTFIGSKANPARLTQYTGRGADQQTTTSGSKIFYNPKTNQFSVQEASGATFGQ
jgi:lipopolysaccharide export system protein LptA